MFRRIFVIFLVSIIFLLPVNAGSLVVGNTIATSGTDELGYDPSSVIVVLKKEYSSPNKKYSTKEFNSEKLVSSNNTIESVKNLMPTISLKTGKQYLRLDIPKHAQKNIEKIIEELKKNPIVESVDKNYRMELLAQPSIKTPNDQNYGSQYDAFNRIQVNRAWMVTQGSSNITVGIVDTGICESHEDFAGKINTALSGSFSISSSRNDVKGHGSHVAGIVGATTNNGVGTAGVGWNVMLANLKCSADLLDIYIGINMDHVADAIDYAEEKGIKIVNCSLGTKDRSTALEDAVRSFSGLIIAACGNKGENECYYPAKYEYDNVISVAATDNNDNLWSDSNFDSKSVDLTAPGVSIYSTHKNGEYAWYNGTSMAAPFVTGTAALIWSINPNFTRTQVKNFILNNVDVLPALNGKVSTGGRLNAFKAVLAASGHIMADVNLDGRVNSSDARLVLRVASMLETINDLQSVLADINYDDVVNSADARIILQMAAGIES